MAHKSLDEAEHDFQMGCALAECKAFFAKMTKVQLNDWYEKTCGYRPSKDDPSMSVSEVRQLCEEYRFEQKLDDGDY